MSKQLNAQRVLNMSDLGRHASFE